MLISAIAAAVAALAPTLALALAAPYPLCRVALSCYIIN